MPAKAKLSDVTHLSAIFLPRAECEGDGGSECTWTQGYSDTTVRLAREHALAHPWHRVVVIRETRTAYAYMPAESSFGTMEP